MIACGLVRGRHKARPLQLTMVWCGRSDERPYGLVMIACGLVRGRHKARPLQLTMVWCGRSNERPYGLDEVGIFNNTLIIIRMYDACGRSNERPYGLSVVRVFDDCAVGGHCCVGTRTASLLCQQHSYTLNVGTYLGASASGGQSMRGTVSNGTRVIGVFKFHRNRTEGGLWCPIISITH